MLNRLPISIAAALFFSCTPVAHAQDIFAGFEHLFTAPRQYIAYQISGAMRIDGKLKEASWNEVEWSDCFTDIEGDKQAAPKLQTRFKLLWDTQYVYIAAELEEPHIWATLKQHDAIIFYDNDFEIFLDPDGDTHNYFEIEVNAFNTIFDLFLNKPYRSGGVPLLNWDVQHLKSAVSLKGTINDANNIDKKWFVEMAIPLHSITLGNKVQVPTDSTVWRVNFSRVQFDTEIIDGSYVKKTDAITHRSLPEYNWVWSPQGTVNMHLPERWGYLLFSTQKAGTAKLNIPLPITETYKKYLWLLFYKQQQYREQHKQYATELSQLNFPSVIEVAALNCHMVLEATGLQYTAIIQSIPGNERWQIDQEGKISKTANP
jgi:hypothetical protein